MSVWNLQWSLLGPVLVLLLLVVVVAVVLNDGVKDWLCGSIAGW
jgi:hypothetical protein